MSDYHIRTQNLKGTIVEAVCHFPIPDTLNEAGISYQTALVRSLGGADAITSVLPEVQGQAEETAMKNGELLEETIQVHFNTKGLTDGQKLQIVEDTYTATKNEILSNEQVTLNFMGYNGDV